MTLQSEANEKWIQHEVELRVHSREFLAMRETLNKLDHKINWIVGIVLTTVITIALHAGGLV